MTFDDLVQLHREEERRGPLPPFRTLHLTFDQAAALLRDLRARNKLGASTGELDWLIGQKIAGWTIAGEASKSQRSSCTCPTCRKYREERFAPLGRKLKEAADAEREAES